MGGRIARFLPGRRAGALHAGSASIRRPTFLTHAECRRAAAIVFPFARGIE